MEPKCLRACADAGHTCTHLHAYDCADAGHTHTHLHTRDCAGAGHTCDWPGETSRGHPTPGALEAIWPPSPSRPLPSSEGASTLIGQVLSGEALGVAYGKLFYAVIHLVRASIQEVSKTCCTRLRTCACSHEGTKDSAHTCEARCACDRFSQARWGGVGWGVALSEGVY